MVLFSCKEKQGANEMKPNPDRHKPETRRRWYRTQHQVQLRIPKSMVQKMRARASAETLPLATWIRKACLTELQRGS